MSNNDNSKTNDVKNKIKKLTVPAIIKNKLISDASITHYSAVDTYLAYAIFKLLKKYAPNDSWKKLFFPMIYSSMMKSGLTNKIFDQYNRILKSKTFVVVHLTKCIMILDTMIVDKDENTKNDEVKPPILRVTCTGPDSDKWIRLIRGYIRKVNRGASENAMIYANKFMNECMSACCFRATKFDNIILPSYVKNNIVNYIENWFILKKKFGVDSVKKHIGILLYGLPGTGKTSIAKAIASKYGVKTYFIDPYSIHKLEDINFTYTTPNHSAIFILEDIDILLDSRENCDTKESKKHMNALLQFLDGVATPENSIIIATTNHIEKLDEAIIRAGRFDLKQEIPNLPKEDALRLVDKLNGDCEILDNIQTIDGLYNPATVQAEVIAAYTKKLIKGENEKDNNKK